MSSVLVALLPDFLLIAVGAALRRTLPIDGWKAIDTLNFKVFFPALIFVAITRQTPQWGDLATVGLGVWLIILAGFGLGWLTRPIGPARFLDFAGMWQTVWRFNIALALVSIQVLPPESQALLSIAVGAAVPLANTLAIGVLSISQSPGWASLLRQVVTNPFFLASAAGVAVSILDPRLPEVPMQAVERLGQAAIPVALLSIGASLNWTALVRFDGLISALTAIKLIVMPTLTLAIAALAGLPHAHVAVLTLFAALPTASASHALASVYSADRDRVATLIGQSTLLACLTLPIWLSILV